MVVHRGITNPIPRPTPRRTDQALKTKVTNLENKLQHIELINQALWEIVQEKLELSTELMRAKMREVDVRDGIEDGKITRIPLRCPSCRRVSSSEHYKCMYCGLEFDRDTL